MALDYPFMEDPINLLGLLKHTHLGDYNCMMLATPQNVMVTFPATDSVPDGALSHLGNMVGNFRHALEKAGYTIKESEPDESGDLTWRIRHEDMPSGLTFREIGNLLADAKRDVLKKSDLFEYTQTSSPTFDPGYDVRKHFTKYTPLAVAEALNDNLGGRTELPEIPPESSGARPLVRLESADSYRATGAYAETVKGYHPDLHNTDVIVHEEPGTRKVIVEAAVSDVRTDVKMIEDAPFGMSELADDRAGVEKLMRLARTGVAVYGQEIYAPSDGTRSDYRYLPKFEVSEVKKEGDRLSFEVTGTDAKGVRLPLSAKQIFPGVLVGVKSMLTTDPGKRFLPDAAVKEVAAAYPGDKIDADEVSGKKDGPPPPPGSGGRRPPANPPGAAWADDEDERGNRGGGERTTW